MADDRVVVQVELTETPAMAAVRKQIEAAGFDPSTMRAPGGRRPPAAGNVTPPTQEQAVQKSKGDRKNVERDFNLRQGIQQENAIDRELDFNLRQRTTDILRDRKRGERVASQQAVAAARVSRPGQGGGAGGARGRRRTGVLRAAAASGAAGAAARAARPFGATAAGAAASGAATAAAINPPAAAAILVGVAIAGAALAPVLLALTGAVAAATRAFTEMEQLGQVDPRVALAQAMRDMRQTLGLIRRSERIGGQASQFITASSQLDQAIRDAGAEILSEILPLLTDVATVAAFLTQSVTPLIVPFFEDIKDLLLRLNELLRKLPFFGDVFAGTNEAIREIRDIAKEAAELDQRLEDANLSRLFDAFDPNDFKPRNIPGISGT